MTCYVDTSALLKRYVDETDSPLARELLGVDPVLVTSTITLVEARRNLSRLLDGQALARARAQLVEDLDSMALVSADVRVCELAADIGERFGVRSLDAIHLGSARRVNISNLSFLTFDQRQAIAARALGLNVVGVG